MSHANVTVTRTVTTSSPNAIFINIGYLKTAAGLLKVLQLILGAAAIFLIMTKTYLDGYGYLFRGSILLMLLMAVAFVICTFCLLISCVFSLSTSGLISKTLYEFVYHLIASILLFIASIILFIKAREYSMYDYNDWHLIISIIGFVNFILYLASTVIAFRDYRY